MINKTFQRIQSSFYIITMKNKIKYNLIEYIWQMHVMTMITLHSICLRALKQKIAVMSDTCADNWSVITQFFYFDYWVMKGRSA